VVRAVDSERDLVVVDRDVDGATERGFDSRTRAAATGEEVDDKPAGGAEERNLSALSHVVPPRASAERLR
jgi:hypothetical protein